ncbi:MAG: Mur ligase family protein [Erysipelotrichaceae bacterium]
MEQSFTFILLMLGYLICELILNKKEEIKPLIFTNRVKRQLLVMILLLLILYFLVISNSIKYNFLLFFIALLPFYLIYLVGLITMPIEMMFHDNFKNKAAGQLFNNKNLIRVGITGSFGKTSTKNIINEVLSSKYYCLMTPASFNTPMGIARTINDSLKPIHQVFICEMGADKVGDISELMDFVKPQYGIVSAIGPQHLATFNNIENIIKEKMEMIEKLPAEGIGIINYDNQYIRDYHINNSCKIYTYGIEYAKVDFFAKDITYNAEGSSFVVVYDNCEYQFTTKLLGLHNILNILSSIALASSLGIDFADIIKAISNVQQVAHRLEVKPYLNFTMIDDSFNANPIGANMAVDVLAMMANQRVLITCGMIELGSQQKDINFAFGQYIVGKADLIFLVGEIQSAPIKEGLLSAGCPKEIIRTFASTKQAMLALPTLAEANATFLVVNDLPDAFNH